MPLFQSAQSCSRLQSTLFKYGSQLATLRCREGKHETDWHQEGIAEQLPGEKSFLQNFSVGPVQLTDWEDRIFWGEEEPASVRASSEEEDKNFNDRGEYNDIYSSLCD